MYRDLAQRDPAETTPAELVCVAKDRDQSGTRSFALFQFVFPVFAGCFVAFLFSPPVGLVAMAATYALLFRARRRPDEIRSVLRMEGREVCVIPSGAKVATARLRLEELLDVTLDTKTIRPVEEGASAIPAMRFADSRVGPDVDTARVVLVAPERGATVPVTDAYLSHMDATEQLGKVRVFLRKHGWLPEDERELESPPSSEDA